MKYQCPRCSISLTPINVSIGSFILFYTCESCKGIGSTFTLLKKYIDEDTTRLVWTNFQVAQHSHYSCPLCAKKMKTITKSIISPFSMCSGCRFTFFSSTEKIHLPNIFHQTRPPSSIKKLTKQERFEYAQNIVESEAEFEYQGNPGGGPTPSLFSLICASLWIALPRKGFPDMQGAKITKYLLIGILIITLFTAFYFSQKQWQTYTGFYPWGFFDNFGINLILSFFTHSGLWHLFSNCLYLRIYGPLVERKLGKKKFRSLIITSALLGNLLFSLAEIEIPTMGASAAICGVLSFYCLSYPKDKVGVYVFGYLRWFWFPTWSALAFLVIHNLIGSFSQLQNTSFIAVNFLAHMGGIIAGVYFHKQHQKLFKNIKL